MQNATTLRRVIMAGRDPLILYVLFRLLTCVPSVVALVIQEVPEKHLQYGPGLIAYAFALSIAVATAYTVILRSQWAADDGSARSPRLVLLILGVGVIDAAGGLWAIQNSGGWGSPFWHVSLAALIVPCAVVGIRWSLGVAAIYLLIQAGFLFMAGRGSVEVWFGAQRYLYVGTIATAFFLSAVVGFLGDVCFELDKSRRRAETALGNLGTILEITQSMAVVTSGVNDLMRRVAQTVGERHSYNTVAIYLSEPGERDLRLSGWLGKREDFEQYAQDADGLIREATAEMDSRLAREAGSWMAAIPIRGRDSLMGVLVMGSDDSGSDAGDATVLGWALVGQIAVGVQIARLRRRLTDAATSEEWDAITRQIHDGISGSMYGLMLHLETHAESARREGNPFSRRLEDLVPPAKELLLDTRHYIYHLLPALRGESCVFTLVENLAWEFEKVSEIPVGLSFSGDRADGGRVPPPVVVGLYHVLKHRMTGVIRSGTATELRVDLDVDPANIRLTVSDDGVIDDPGSAESRRRMEHLRRAAGDMGGELEIVDSRGSGTRIEVDLAIKDGKVVKRDQLNNR